MLGPDIATGLVQADELLEDAAEQVGRHFADGDVQDQLLGLKREEFENARYQV